MKRRALDNRTAQLYGFEIRYRRYDTCAADLVGDLFEERQLFLRGELIGDCPAWCLGGKTEFFLLC